MTDYEKQVLDNFQHHSHMLYLLYEKFEKDDKLLHDFKVLLIEIEQKFLWSMFDFKYKEELAEILWKKNLEALKDQVKSEKDRNLFKELKKGVEDIEKHSKGEIDLRTTMLSSSVVE